MPESSLYYVYVDEAGTSGSEPISIVVSVILHADKHREQAARYLQEILDFHVPAAIRKNFIFHAKDILNGRQNPQLTWSLTNRLRLIRDVAAIAGHLKAAISIAKVRRDVQCLPDGWPVSRPAADFHHMLAFWLCLARSDKYIRDWGAPKDGAKVVAEDVPKKKPWLRAVLNTPAPSFPIDAEHVRLTVAEKETGTIFQKHAGEMMKIKSVDFAKKDGDPLLQVADAWAFIFRRYLAGQPGGKELVDSLLTPPLVWEDWLGPISEFCFSFDPDKRYDWPVVLRTASGV